MPFTENGGYSNNGVRWTRTRERKNTVDPDTVYNNRRMGENSIYSFLLQSFQMISRQLGVFRSPRVRIKSPPLPSGTEFMARVFLGFLLADFLWFEALRVL